MVKITMADLGTNAKCRHVRFPVAIGRKVDVTLRSWGSRAPARIERIAAGLLERETLQTDEIDALA